ncbi:MAG: CHAT domain-containing protein [Chloracidobacterium sp.]|nr:CHAT domain-containing protein [Chloracidobacterium sp.]
MAIDLEIRDYLLGDVSDPEQLGTIEERYLTDDDFAESVSLAEDQIIEQYLDDELTDQQRHSFETHFLTTDHRRHQLRTITGLLSAARARATPDAVSENQVTKARFPFQTLFSNPLIGYGFAIILIASSVYGFWRLVIYRSNVDVGLAQLREAYAGERPIEARISGFQYSPWRTTRGNGGDVDPAARDRAEKLLTLAAGETDDTASQAALGKFLLTQRKFEQANELFARAAKSAPKDARIHSDWGASLLELARIDRSSGDRSKSAENFDAALSHLETAIAIMPSMLEARFNRALCLQEMLLNEQAKAAWLEYLSFDDSSRWAEEARQHLEKLNTLSANETPADDILAGFLRSAADGDDEKAFTILAGNRELISRKYIPQLLAMTFITSPEDKRPAILNALDLAGRLESERIGDKFAAEIAAFYRKLDPRSFNDLRDAQASVLKGYALCIAGDYKLALAEFANARRIFEKNGDIWEGNLSKYFEGYCQINLGEVQTGLDTVDKVVEFARTANYRWLEMTALYWLAGAQRNLRQHSISKLIYRRAFSLAEQIGDRYGMQRNLLESAGDSSFLGQHNLAIDGLVRAFEISNSGYSSSRQRCRLSLGGSDVYLAAGLTTSARNAAEDALILAKSVNDPMLTVISRNKAGTAYLNGGDPATAKQYFDTALSESRAFADEVSRNKMTALSYLQMARLERSGGDLQGSTDLYRQADTLYDDLAMPYYQYVAEKGVLSGLKELGDNAELDRLLPLTIKLTEDYQDKISEESERASFLDDGITIYDLALEREFEKGELGKAFTFSESSASRTLYRRLAAKNDVAPRPLTIDEIRDKMPADTQILKFSVLMDRTLVWLISKRDVSVTPINIASSSLRDKVGRYYAALKSPDADLTLVNSLSRELFDLLIRPVSDKLDRALDIAVVPNKFLFYLPFASLLNERNEPLIASHTLVYSPSASVFILCSLSATGSPKTSETILAIGDPAFDRSTFPELTVLPAAADEALNIRGQYGSGDVLTGSSAVKPDVLKLIGQADVLHFAGHYVVVDREPESSFLLLAKQDNSSAANILTNAELAGQDLGGLRLVVLSACRTGLDKYFDGEGMVGISRTFLAAGVPVVIASQWTVDSDATSILMKSFHKDRRSGGMKSADALRQAQLSLAASNGGKYSSPYYWAAFSVIGGDSKY